MITIDKLKKNFGEKVAVDIEHYEINQGDMLGLVGNNGAGKTTMIRLLTGLAEPTTGKIALFGESNRNLQSSVSALAVLLRALLFILI